MSVACTVDNEKFDAQVPLLIVGAGAAGLRAALAAKGEKRTSVT
jgi:succinate dehydrogenase/fumarate reductase flavoprotein subunit